MELNYIIALLALLVYFPIFVFGIIRKNFAQSFMKLHATTKKDYAIEGIAGFNYAIIIALFLLTKITETQIIFYIGFCIYVVSLVITFSGYYTFLKKPKGTLLLDWPFNISRNPTYFFGLIALSSLTLITLSVNSVVHAVLIFLQIVLTHHIILKEEAYCEETYKKEYLAYKSKTKRYFSIPKKKKPVGR